MRWNTSKRRLGVYALLLAGALAVCAWQRQEHLRFERNAAQALINRGRDITSTLGIVVRAQRRAAGIISKERIESALHDLIRPGEVETIASAGRPVELTPEMLRARGVYWSSQALTLMNLMDLGAPSSADDTSRPP